MVQQVSASSQSEFPHPTEALRLGWAFFKANFWITVLFAVGSGSLYALSDWFGNTVSDSDTFTATVAFSALASFALAVVGAIFELGLWRRTLDYWDETHGVAAPRKGSEALRAAFDGASQRAFPYIGWSVLFGVVAVVLFIAGFAIADALGFGALIASFLIMVVALFVLDFLAAFFVVAVADRPGNPLSRSIHVFKGHFWRIVGAYLLFLVAILVGVLPLLLLVVIFDGADVVTIIAGVAIVAFALLLRGAFTAARTAMYRSVYPPAPNSNT